MGAPFLLDEETGDQTGLCPYLHADLVDCTLGCTIHRRLLGRQDEGSGRAYLLPLPIDIRPIPVAKQKSVGFSG